MHAALRAAPCRRRLGLEGDSQGQTPVAFGFGGGKGWDRLSVYFCTAAGQLYTLCPVVPFGEALAAVRSAPLSCTAAPRGCLYCRPLWLHSGCMYCWPFMAACTAGPSWLHVLLALHGCMYCRLAAERMLWGLLRHAIFDLVRQLLRGAGMWFCGRQL